MKINREQLPMMSVLGEVDHPSLSGDGHWVGHDGYGRIAMSVGGIVYNYALLDRCMGIAGDHIENAVRPNITAQCLRVPVSDGHTAACFVSFEHKPSKEQILEAWADFSGEPQALKLPSAPEQFIHYFEENDRPQPKLDRMCERGMAVCAGRLREDCLFDYKFIGFSHNTLRGAAGGAVLLAELLAAKGYFD